MSGPQETPRPPATPEFGAVTPGGPPHHYPAHGGLSVTKLAYGRFDNNVYVLRAGDEALLIDGSAPPDVIEPLLGGASLRGIFITHGHPDHTQSLDRLGAHWDVPVYAHEGDAWFGGFTFIDDGATIELGPFTLELWHTPGHTPASTCLRAPGFLFSGDALFPGGPGNTDGDPDRFAAAMTSIDRMMSLPDETRVCPGHGVDTTIGRERPAVAAWRERGW